MAVEKFNPLVVEQMANEKLVFIRRDAEYLQSIINASRPVSSRVITRIRKGPFGSNEYFKNNSGEFIFGTQLDVIKTTHGKDRLYLLRDLTLVEVLNFDTLGSEMVPISTLDAMIIYDADNAAYAIMKILPCKNNPRNRILPDGSVQLETVTGQIIITMPKLIMDVLPQMDNTSMVMLEYQGIKRSFEIKCKPDLLRDLAAFQGFAADESEEPTS